MSRQRSRSRLRAGSTASPRAAAGGSSRTARQQQGSRRPRPKPILASCSSAYRFMRPLRVGVSKRRRCDDGSGGSRRARSERVVRRQCCAGMADRPRAAPVFGALLAAAASLYAARDDARPPEPRAERPRRPGWGRILANTWNELDRDFISVMAAGVAFYSFLSIFPGMSALISLYGLVADPAVIARQVESLSGVLPQEALKLVSDQMHALIAAPPGKLGIGLIVSLLLTLWSATS